MKLARSNLNKRNQKKISRKLNSIWFELALIKKENRKFNICNLFIVSIIVLNYIFTSGNCKLKIFVSFLNITILYYLSYENKNKMKETMLMKDKNSNVFGKCRICYDKASGIHYRVATCEGCKVLKLLF
jgi:hypothetical protein